MNVLFPIAEATPIYKIGGLGDVAAALPKALTQLGVDVRLAVPFHPEIDRTHLDTINVATFTIDYAEQTLPVSVFLTHLPNTQIPVYLFAENKYLSQHTDASDNHADKFAVFSLAVSTFTCFYTPHWQPHVIHCHDWHTALIPVLLKHKFHKDYKTIITIHNLAYQGITTTPVAPRLSLNPQICRIIDWDSADGDLNILLEGILHSDLITTVSPTYAKEILTQEYGEKIESIVEARKDAIHGVLNGLDTEDFNPATDPYLPHHYSSDNWQQGKLDNRQALQHQLHLSSDPNTTVIGFVGRVDPYQKGIGLIIQALKEKALPPNSTQFIFLGTGDPNLESQLHQAGDSHPNVRIITRFDEPLARLIYAASHVCVIPSRFEPCGLVQLIAMRYGSLPIARATGGLKDTITHNHNGFLFEAFSTEAFIKSMKESLTAIANHDTYNRMVNNAINQDLSWQKSATQYAMLYQELVMGRKLLTIS